GAVAGDRGRDELRRGRDRVRDQAADRIIGAGRAAGADPEEGRSLGKGEARRYRDGAEREAGGGDFRTMTQRHSVNLPLKGAISAGLGAGSIGKSVRSPRSTAIW